MKIIFGNWEPMKNRGNGEGCSNNKTGERSGFSLVEVLIYTAIIALSSVFLVGILGTMTKIQTRQVSVNEVNQQISFAGKTIQKLVADSSLIDIAPGVATSTLILRMASSTLDPTKVYASSGILYVEQGTSTVFAVTDSSVKVDNFTVTKYEPAGGFTVVQVDLAISYNTTNPQSQITKVLKSAISRITAATFDSSLNPNVDNALDLGNAGLRWRSGYFSSNVQIDGRLGVGGAPPAGTFYIKTAGDVGYSTSTVGLVLMAPNGTCYRLGISNSGTITTSTAACP
jgi:type II secretory pathway pseudopilin PulG